MGDSDLQKYLSSVRKDRERVYPQFEAGILQPQQSTGAVSATAVNINNINIGDEPKPEGWGLLPTPKGPSAAAAAAGLLDPPAVGFGSPSTTTAPVPPLKPTGGKYGKGGGKQQHNKQHHKQNLNNNQAAAAAPSRPSPLAARFNVKPPCLARDHLPSPEFVAQTIAAFSRSRDLLLEVRATLATVAEYERALLEAQGSGSGEQNNNNNSANVAAAMDLRRRQREEDDDNDTSHDEEDDDDADSIEQLARITHKKSHKDARSAAKAAAQTPLSDKIASEIIDNNLNSRLFERCVPPHAADLGDKRWDDVLRSLTRATQSQDGVTSFAPISLLARFTPGMAQALLRAAIRSFVRTACFREASDNQCFGEDGSNVVLTVDVSDATFPQQQRQQQQPPVQDQSTLRSLLFFLASMRAGAVGSWLYAALAGVELPLGPDLASSLQEVLRIACESLTLLFGARPDILREVLQHQNQSNNNNNNRRQQQQQNNNRNADSANYNNNTWSKATMIGENQLLVEVKPKGVSFFTAADARALMTLIVVVGKYFGQANRALLPL